MNKYAIFVRGAGESERENASFVLTSIISIQSLILGPRLAGRSGDPSASSIESGAREPIADHEPVRLDVAYCIFYN